MSAEALRRQIPALYCPLSSAIHPDADAIGARSLEWPERLGVFALAGARELATRARAAQWACRIAPHGDIDRLQIVSDWTHLGFLIDDYWFDAGELAHRPELMVPMAMRAMVYLDHPEVPGPAEPFAAGLRDLSARARACAPLAVVRRWVLGNMEWFYAVACLTAYRRSGAMPSLEEYVNLGPRDRAMHLTGSLIELAEGTYLPDEDRESPAIRAATQPRVEYQRAALPRRTRTTRQSLAERPGQRAGRTDDHVHHLVVE